MLPCPNKELDAYLRRMATYGMASSMSQALFNELISVDAMSRSKLLAPG